MNFWREIRLEVITDDADGHETDTPVTADLTGVSVDTRDADGDITESVAEAPTEEGKGVNVEAVTTEGSVVPTTPRIITPADLNGAPVILERAAARPVLAAPIRARQIAHELAIRPTGESHGERAGVSH